MCSLSGKMLIFFSLSRSVSLDLVSGHIETVRRTATRTSLLVCVCFIIRLRWSLKHFEWIVESYPGSLWFRRLRYLIGPEKTPATFSVNQIKNCNQSWLGHEFALSCALSNLLGFTMSSHRLLELPPSHLIGFRDYYGFNLQHLIEMRSKVFWLFFVVLLSQRNHYSLSSKYELFLA